MYYCNYANDVLQKARTGQIDLDGIIKNTERQYKNEILEFSDRIGFTDEEIFAQSFHWYSFGKVFSFIRIFN